MGELLRLLGLSQDGALVPYLLGGLGVWAVMSLRGVRTEIKRGEATHATLATKIDTLDGKVNGIAVDVGRLLGRPQS